MVPRRTQATPTFLSSPSALDTLPAEVDIAVLGVPHGIPYGMRGLATDCANAPAAIREHSLRYGLGQFLMHHDFDFDGPVLNDRDVRFIDCGNIAVDPLDLRAGSRHTTEVVRSILDASAVPVVLGGDDSIPIPVLRAWEGREPITVVQIDAHLDFRDEIGGVREGLSSPMRRASEMPWVTRIVQVGMRGVGSARSSDVMDARRSGNLIFPSRDVHRNGVDQLLTQIPRDTACFITIDFDGFDPSIAPAVGAPVPGGLSFEHVADIVRGVAERTRIAGIDLVELMPSRDVNGITSILGVRIIMSLIGAMARAGQIGRSPGS